MGKSWYVCSLRRFGHYESLWNANLCNFNVKVQVKDFMNKFIPIFHCETQISATFCRFCWMTWSGPSERMKMLGLVPTISWQISQPYSKLLFFGGGGGQIISNTSACPHQDFWHSGAPNTVGEWRLFSNFWVFRSWKGGWFSWHSDWQR